jgi:hypothetical protein
MAPAKSTDVAVLLPARVSFVATVRNVPADGDLAAPGR